MAPAKKTASAATTALNDEPEEFRKSLEEIRKSLEYLTEEVAKLTKQQANAVTTEQLKEEMLKLTRSNKEKDEKIVVLDRRVDDLEQIIRMGDVVFSGLEIKPRSYARAGDTDRGMEEAVTEVNSIEKQVTQFLESKEIQIDANNIAACYTIRRRDQPTKPTVIVTFANKKHKIALLQQGRKLKGTSVYMNENLTKRNGEIAREARYLKKQNKIESTWCWNCKVFIKLSGTRTEGPKTLMVRDMKDLAAYK